MAKNDKSVPPVALSKAPAGPANKGIKVTARPASFRRAGHTFTGEAKVIPADQLTEEQLHQIINEPNLVVQPVDIEPPDDEME
jgi:hypothetical protein